MNYDTKTTQVEIDTHPRPQPLAHAARLARWRRWSAEPQAFEALLEEIADGLSLHAWTSRNGFAHMTVVDWIGRDPKRSVKYARARELQAEAHVENILRIVDEPVLRLPSGAVDPGAVADKRLRIDVLKWAASKLAPRHYGDRVAVEATVAHDVVGELRAFMHQRKSLLPISSGAD